MGLLKKKKSEGASQDALVKVLGTGCDMCARTEKNAIDALKESGMDCEVAHVTDVRAIAGYGVMRTPALVIGDDVVAVGRVPSKEEIMKMLKEAVHDKDA
jgi:small redox-active disulfide protein 2